MLLRQYTALPEGLLTARPEDLHRLIPEPTLFHLSGKNQQPLFISVLLHGNEPTGLFALQAIFKNYQDKTLPRSLCVFFGNTLAAKQGLRRLETQPDYNRIWPSTEIGSCLESQIAAEIFSVMQQRQPFASIDIHNNTGINPHYACINKLDNRYLQLASLFGRLIVYFIHPKGAQSLAFAELCPAVTLECGRLGQQYGVDHAIEFINSCLHLSAIPEQTLGHQAIDLYHTVAQITIAKDCSFGFNDNQVELILNDDLERMNFTEIPAGTVLGQINGIDKLPVIATNQAGQDVTDNYFTIIDKQLQITQTLTPIMLTLNQHVIQLDCLCYFMERLKYG